MRIFGIVLIIAGIAMLVFRGFNFTSTKNVANVGPVEINKKENHSVSWPMYTGGIALICGIVVVISSAKSKQ